MGTVIAIISDLHINSAVGLAPLRHNLDDGGTYEASRTQRWLHDCWRLFWSDVELAKTQTGYPLLTIFNGDIGELDAKARTHQVITRNKSTVLEMIRSVIERPVALSDWALFIRGTASHIGKGGWLEEEIAQDCDIAIRRDTGAASWWNWRGEIGSLVLDIQHHARLGSKPWTVANPLGDLAVRVELSAHRARQKVPGLVVRSHRHTFADTGNIYPVRVCTSGAWQAIPEYAYKADFTAPPDIGGLIVTVGDNGEWTIIQKRYQMRMSKIQTLPPINGKST
jgi:hypothetical protein